MTATGAMGRPREVFNPLHIPDARAADFDDYVHRVCLDGTTQNGVFAIKANFRQVAPFVRAGAIPGPYHWRYLYLTREDLVLQAVSWHRAAATRSWRSDQPESGVAVFDEAAIWARVSELAEMMRAWELFFATVGVAPLRVTYEQLLLDRRAVLRAIARHGDVSVTDEDLARDVPYVRQRTDENERWAEMLVSGRTQRIGRSGL
jgi:LPS sulfotransferase NodH